MGKEDDPSGGSQDKTSKVPRSQDDKSDEKGKSTDDNDELTDKEVWDYFQTDPNEVEANKIFEEIKDDPEIVGDFEKYYDSDGEYKEPHPVDGYYREGPFVTKKLPPNYFDLNVKDLDHYESENDDSVDPMEVEESKKARDPSYLKSINLDDDNEEIDLDKIDFSQFRESKKKYPEEFIIEAGAVHPSIVEDMRAIPIDIITREEWGARPRPEGERPLKLPVLYVHMEYYTPVDPCFTKEDCIKAAREIQRIQMEEQGLPDIAHNFLIGGDGNVYEGRGWNVKAEKSNELPKYSGKYLEFAYIGDYRVAMQTNLIMKTQFSLIQKGLDLKNIDEYFTLIQKHLNLTRDWIGK